MTFTEEVFKTPLRVFSQIKNKELSTSLAFGESTHLRLPACM